MDRSLNYIALARKAGKAELGEEPVGAAARALHAHLIIVASDASDHTWRRAKSFAAGTKQQCIRVSYTKDEIGAAIGRQSLAIAAITDAAMAKAFVESLGDPEKYGAALEVLAHRAERIRQRQVEAKAHERNKRMGKRRSPATKKEH